MTNPDAGGTRDPRIIETLKSDIGRGDFIGSVRREIRDTREFLVDEQRRQRLGQMNVFKRFFVTAWWMLKGLFFRLTPVRRLIFVIGLLFILFSRSVIYDDGGVHVESETSVAGILCIILVLMLELKDKLLAKEELEAGRAVQNALAPPRSPELPGWKLWLYTRSANEVGGDLVDFIELDGGKAGLVLGDVAGKGLRAALLMAKLQATVRAVAGDMESLSDMASKVNRIFCRDSLKNIFASMVYLELVPGSGRVRVVNAGHFPPVVVKAGGVSTTQKGGAALGLTPAAVYTESELTLEPGEILCAYSDGVCEAQNVVGDFFGEERIRTILGRNFGKPVDAVGTEIVRVVNTFVGEAKRRDDLTLILVGRAA